MRIYVDRDPQASLPQVHISENASAQSTFVRAVVAIFDIERQGNLALSDGGNISLSLSLCVSPLDRSNVC